jgi:hypothetical protein
MRETLRVGGVAVSILCDEPGVGALVHGSERLFLTKDDDVADLRVTVRRLDHYEPPRGECLFDSGLVWSLHRDGDALRIECRSPLFGPNPYKIAVFDEALTRAEVFGTELFDALEFPLGELLFNALLTQRGAIEVHACGVIENGEGIVFLGNSGDGKTTTARLWQSAAPDVEVVSDDRVILRPHDGVWWMYGSPWHGDAEICSTSRAPLRRIFSLHQATANGVKPLTPAKATARILACAFPPFHDVSELTAVVNIAVALASAVPVARFSFVNDPAAVTFIRNLPGARAA